MIIALNGKYVCERYMPAEKLLNARKYKRLKPETYKKLKRAAVMLENTTILILKRILNSDENGHPTEAVFKVLSISNDQRGLSQNDYIVIHGNFLKCVRYIS